jgi:hypothetical protein
MLMVLAAALVSQILAVLVVLGIVKLEVEPPLLQLHRRVWAVQRMLPMLM